MKIHEVLHSRGISQRSLSIQANIANQDLNAAMNGKKPFFPAWRKRVAAVLEISEDDLFPEYKEE